MEKKLTKESWINMITATILSGMLFYLSSSFGELIAAFQVFPFLVLYVNEGWKLTVLSMLISFVIGYFFVNPISLLYMALFILLATFYLGYGIKRKEKVGTLILNTTFIKLSLMILLFALGYYITKVNPIEEMKNMLYLQADKMADTLGTGIDMTKDDLNRLLVEAKRSIDMTIEVLPALMFIGSYVVSAVNTFIALKILKKTRNDIGYETRLNRYGAGINLKIASVVLGVSALILSLVSFQHSEIFVNNVIALLSFFYFMNGLLLSDYLYQKSGHKILRFLVPIVILLVFRSVLVYVILGIADLVLGLRRRKFKNGNKE